MLFGRSSRSREELLTAATRLTEKEITSGNLINFLWRSVTNPETFSRPFVFFYSHPVPQWNSRSPPVSFLAAATLSTWLTIDHIVDRRDVKKGNRADANAHTNQSGTFLHRRAVTDNYTKRCVRPPRPSTSHSYWTCTHRVSPCFPRHTFSSSASRVGVICVVGGHTNAEHSQLFGWDHFRSRLIEARGEGGLRCGVDDEP